MKKTLATMLFLTSAATASVVHADEQTVALNVQNMTCAGCGPIVEWTLQFTPGVLSVEVIEDYLLSPPVVARVFFDDAITNVETLVAALAAVGFPATPLLPGYVAPALDLGDPG